MSQQWKEQWVGYRTIWLLNQRNLHMMQRTFPAVVFGKFNMQIIQENEEAGDTELCMLKDYLHEPHSLHEWNSVSSQRRLGAFNMAADVRGLAQLGPHCGDGFYPAAGSWATLARPGPDSENRIRVSVEAAAASLTRGIWKCLYKAADHLRTCGEHLLPRFPPTRGSCWLVASNLVPRKSQLFFHWQGAKSLRHCTTSVRHFINCISIA